MMIFNFVDIFIWLLLEGFVFGFDVNKVLYIIVLSGCEIVVVDV